MLLPSLTIATLAASTLAREAYVYDTHSLYKRDGGSHHHSAPSSSYGAPEASYGAPEASYGAPEPSYSAPAPSYSVPSDSYASPDTGYGAPEPSYGAPEPSYGSPSVPSYGAESGGIDLTSILIPLLALLGLSLLFPTYVSLTDVRKKRSADQGESRTDIYTSTLSDKHRQSTH